jgi:rare lipoprotein A
MNTKDKAYKRPKDYPDDVDEYPELNDYVDKLVSTQYHDASGVISWIVIAIVLGLVAAVFIVNPLSCRKAHAQDEDMKYTASYYTAKSCQREGTSGVWTASGERYDENALTCAMRRRDWGTMFRVTNIETGKSVVVRLNDFGPNKKLHAKGRIVDLSKGAFNKIADLKQGVIRVKVEEVR